MTYTIKQWNEVEPSKMRELFLKNPAPPYIGTPLAERGMREYLYSCAQKAAIERPSQTFAVLDGETLIATAMIKALPYLNDWFHIHCCGFDHIVFKEFYNVNQEKALAALFDHMQECCRKEGIEFITLNIPARAISLTRALESQGFKYAEGYLQMVSDTNTPYDENAVSGLVIRDAVETDLDDVHDVYKRVRWPSHLTTEPGFDEAKSYELYYQQMLKIYEQRSDRKRLVIGELNGYFAAALIMIVDEDLYHATGILTNPLHGMALVVHPDARRQGISMQMVAYRQRWYRDIGVKWVDLTPNFNNTGMIRSLEKIGFRYGSVRMTYHKWLVKK